MSHKVLKVERVVGTYPCPGAVLLSHAAGRPLPCAALTLPVYYKEITTDPKQNDKDFQSE